MTSVPLSRARILLIISGGIAAYKSLELIRRLRDRGATVQVVMTAAARQFISPLSAATLSGQAVRDDLFSLTDEAAIGHIELSRAADLIVVAPASANILARMAGGLADDLATTAVAGDRQTRARRPGDERQDVAAPGDPPQPRAPQGRRRSVRRPRIGADGVRRIRSWPHGRAAGDRRGDRAGVGRRSGVQSFAPSSASVIRVRSADGMSSSLPARPTSRSTRSGSSETGLLDAKGMQLRKPRLALAQG